MLYRLLILTLLFSYNFDATLANNNKLTDNEQASLRERHINSLSGIQVQETPEFREALLNIKVQDESKIVSWVEPYRFKVTFQTEEQRRLFRRGKYKKLQEYEITVYAISQCLWHGFYGTRYKPRAAEAYHFEGPFSQTMEKIRKSITKHDHLAKTRKYTKPANSYLHATEDYQLNLKDHWLKVTLGFDRSVHDHPEITSWKEKAYILYEINVRKVKSS